MGRLPPPGPAAGADPPTRLRLAAVSLALTVLFFSQSAGYPATDTKLDLVVSPWRFLRKSLVLWNPIAAAGQLQDQAYGYLFPMGPVFGVLHALALPAWIVQRGWESALLVAAFLGVVRLARLLGVPGFWPWVAAGLAYALAPRMVSEIAVISAELLPVAALPWVLIPLVRGSRRGSPRRAGAASAVAFLFAGGVNATASVAILPVPALWLLAHRPGGRRRALGLWWVASIGLASLWWLIPLLVLGRYSPPFLGWIESSAVTTSPTSLVATLRGADHWQAYLGPSVWPGAWLFVAAPAVILATAVIAALGLGGLARSATPHRRFLLACLGVGLLGVTAGHVATVGPLFAGPVRALLDGALAPLRNVHKFDPVLRLPICLGVGHAVAALWTRVPERLTVRPGRPGVDAHTRPVWHLSARPLTILALAAVLAVAITPVLAGKVVPQTRSVADASWWRQAALWLATQPATGRALVIPGAAQPVYAWGSTRDDALQPVADSAWTVRDSTPLTQAGYVRWLDAVEQRFAAGVRDPVLAALLARAGVGYVVVRNDLNAPASAATALYLVHATINLSPGLVRAAEIGPVSHAATDPGRLVDAGATRDGAAVEIYRVTEAVARVSLVPASNTVAASGSSDDLGALAARGLLPGRAVVFGADGAPLARSKAAPMFAVATDGIRRREVTFGAINAESATMTAHDPFTTRRAVHDYLPTGPPQPYSTRRLLGIAGVSASSSGGSAAADANRGAANGPAAAVDGDPGTAWRSGLLQAVGQWWQVDFGRARSFPTIRLAFAGGLGGFPGRLTITTDTGRQTVAVTPGDVIQTVDVPHGPTTFLRLTVAAMASNPNPPSLGFSTVGLATVAVPGVAVSSTLDVDVGADPDVLAFDIAPGYRADCLSVNGRAACDPANAGAGEEDAALDRSFTLPVGEDFRTAAQVAMRPGAALDTLLDAGRPVTATASSVNSTDPRERPGAAVDGRPETSWVAAAGDRFPTLTLRLARASTVRGLRISTDALAPATRALRVRVRAGTAVLFDGALPAGGRIRFARPTRADTVAITVTSESVRASRNSATGRTRLLPVGISEVRLDAGSAAPDPAPSLALTCGSGVALVVDGRAVALHADVPTESALRGEPFLARPCGSDTVALAAGGHRLRLARDELVLPRALTLSRAGTDFSAAPRPPGIVTAGVWGATHRIVTVSAPTESILVVSENANAGWHARVGGRTLLPIRIDGWEQGWVVPGGTRGSVDLRFDPQTPFVVGLAVGAVAVLLLLALAWTPAGRAPAPTISTGARSVGLWWWRGGVLIVALLLGSGWGLAAGGAVVVTAAAAGRFGLTGHLRQLAPSVSGVLILLAGLLEAMRPTGTVGALAGTPPVQLLCLLALAVAAVAAEDVRRENRRSKGRSIANQDSAATASAEAALSVKRSRNGP